MGLNYVYNVGDRIVQFEKSRRWSTWVRWLIRLVLRWRRSRHGALLIRAIRSLGIFIIVVHRSNGQSCIEVQVRSSLSAFVMSVTDGSSFSLGEQSTRKLLLFIIIPMSLVVFTLSVCIIVLLSKSNCRGRKHCFYPHYYRKTRDCSSVPGFSHSYTNNVLYRAHRNRLFLDKRNQQHIYPIQSELCIRRVASNPVYSTASSQSLPSVALSSSPSMITSSKTQTLSVNRFCRSYV